MLFDRKGGVWKQEVGMMMSCSCCWPAAGSLWTGRRGEIVCVFNAGIGICVIGRMWRSDVDSSCSTAKDIDGGSPVAVAGTVVIEEDLIKRDLYSWSREEPEGA